MYILKIKSRSNVPDYIQIRDNDFTLLAYCSIDNLRDTLTKLGKSSLADDIIEIAKEARYWQIKKVNING